MKEDVRLYGAVESHEPPRAPEEREWDADAAEQRIRAWAGGPEKEKIDWAKYRQGFAWYNEEDPENIGSYKLPHHDIIDGRLHTVWKGVVAAAGVMMGARGGVELPEGDVAGVKNHIARHYHQWDRLAPWEAEVRSIRLYSFRWLTRPITEEEARALRLVKGVAIHVGLSKRQPTPDQQTEENLLRGGRSLRGALIDIDHSAVMEVDTTHYKEKYGLESLFPIGQVVDAEYEDEKVEYLASIWDDKVYEMIEKGMFKGSSVVEEYRSEQIRQIDGMARITEGSTFPLLALCLETEPAYPNTWIRLWRPEAATSVPEEQAKAKLQEPLILEVPIPDTKTAKKYSLTASELKIETVKLADDLEDKVAHAIVKIKEEMDKKFEALKDEIRLLREEKTRVELELQILKEDHMQLKEFGRAPPTGLIEAAPSKQTKGKICDHTNFLAALPEDRDIPRKLPTEFFRGWMEAVERDTQGCAHEKFIKPYTINKDFIPVKFVGQETLLNWAHNVRRVLSREVE